jgi:hypothetical protein
MALLGLVCFYGLEGALGFGQAVQDKYVMRRYGQVQFFPLFAAVNPLLVAALCAAQVIWRRCRRRPRTDDPPRVRMADSRASASGAEERTSPRDGADGEDGGGGDSDMLTVMIAGAVIQALAFLWPLFWTDSPWAIVAQQLQATLGEVLVFPRLSAYVLAIAGPKHTARFLALGRVPAALWRFLVATAAGVLLEYHCPPPPANAAVGGLGASCSPLLWAYAPVPAMVTPILLLVLGLVTRDLPQSATTHATASDS